MPNAILDPTGTVTTSAAKPAAPRAPRLASLDGKRVGLLINTKQNARPFLDEVGRLLAGPVRRHRSPSGPRSTSPCPSQRTSSRNWWRRTT